MDDAALFDEIVKANNLGPRIEDHRLQKHPAVERFTCLLRSRVGSTVPQFSGLADIFASFIADPEFNAWAAKHGDRYFIGIHAGLLNILTTVVFRLMADPRTFPDIGDPSEEVGNLPTFSRITPDATACGFQPVSPKNPRRVLFAMLVCDLAFDFVVNHELTHIGHGHVGYTNAEFGLPFLGERRWLAGTPAGNLESLAMEMDADFKAAEQLMKRVRGDLSGRDPSSGFAEFFSDTSRAMLAVAAAVSIQSRMFGDTRVALADLSTQDHPPDRWRQLMVLNVMANYAEEFWGSEAHASVMAAVNRAIAEVEEAFERMTGQPQEIQGLHDTWHGEGWEYARAVLDCWNNTLLTKLEKYTFVGLRSYDFDLPQKP